MCRRGHAVDITAPTAPLKCVQCMMTISTLQYTGRCAECGFICLQCFFNANCGLSCTGKLDGSQNLQLKMVGERIWKDLYIMWDVDEHGGPLENQSGMTRYGFSCGQLGCRTIAELCGA